MCNCRSVGKKIHNRFGSGYRKIWLENPLCYGYESSLDKCSHGGWRYRYCDSSSVVAVSCMQSQPSTLPPSRLYVFTLYEKQVLPVLHCFKRGIAFVSSSLCFLSRWCSLKAPVTYCVSLITDSVSICWPILTVFAMFLAEKSHFQRREQIWK